MPARLAPAAGTRTHTLTWAARRLAVRSIHAKTRAPNPATTPSAAARREIFERERWAFPVTVRSAAVP